MPSAVGCTYRSEAVTLPVGGNLHDRECIGTSFPQAGQHRLAQRMHNKLLGPFQRIIANLLMLMVKRKFQG